MELRDAKWLAFAGHTDGPGFARFQRDLLQANLRVAGQTRFPFFEPQVGELRGREESDIRFSWSIVKVNGDLRWVVWITQDIEVDHGAKAPA